MAQELDQTLTILLALAGKTRRELARQLGIDESSLSRSLRGERPLAAARRRQLIALIVGGLVDDAMGPEGRVP